MGKRKFKYIVITIYIRVFITDKKNVWESYRKDMKDPKFRAALKEFIRIKKEYSLMNIH